MYSRSVLCSAATENEGEMPTSLLFGISRLVERFCEIER